MLVVHSRRGLGKRDGVDIYSGTQKMCGRRVAPRLNGSFCSGKRADYRDAGAVRANGHVYRTKERVAIPNQPPPVGTYAPVLLLFFGTKFTGATIQFRPTGQHLNAPGLGAPQSRPEIAVNLANKVIDPQNPALFTLVLRVERSASDSQGEAMLFVG